MIERFFRILALRNRESVPQASPPIVPPPIVPKGGERGLALGVVIAIMTFLASLALGAVGLISNAAQDWQGQISREATIQIVPMDGMDMEKALTEAHQLITSFAGIAEAHILNKQETQKLLEPWLGHDTHLADLAELDLPGLILVRFKEGQQPDIDLIRARLQQDIQGALFDDHHLWLDRLSSMGNTLVLASSAIFILVLVTMVVTAFFATRAILLMHAHIIEVLHFLGADSVFVARQFDRYFFKLGFKGGGWGAVGAILTFWLLSINLGSLWGTAEGTQFSLLFGTFSLGFGSLAAIAALVVFVAVLVMFTAKATVIRQLHEIDRYPSDF